ncbi:hypothetical protein BJF79_42870, partial [Actinomadura sp. CNU-125]
MLPETAQVLVVGAGPVGLSAAAFLGWHGIETVVVERHEGRATHPRARGLTPRTMELLRGIGLEDRVRGTESARELAGNDGIIVMDTLAGRPLGGLDRSYFQFDAAAYDGLAPTSWCMCHQHELEPILLGRARELGADVRYTTECTDLEPLDDGVAATLRPVGGGAARTLRARYVVAADGAGSRVRERLGIGMSGPGRLGFFLNIEFRADLAAVLGDRRFIMCYIAGAGVRCALLPVNNADHWMLHVMCDPEETAEFTPERCAELVRAAAGVPDLEVDVRSALPWESAGRVADRFRAGNVFLAGDSAHVMPPTGAFGSNTGVQDAHNLAWKLAAVLQGRAAAPLLDTYEDERRPVAEATVRQAVLRSKDRPGAGGAAPDPDLVPDPVVVLGQRYRSRRGRRRGRRRRRRGPSGNRRRAAVRAPGRRTWTRAALHDRPGAAALRAVHRTGGGRRVAGGVRRGRRGPRRPDRRVRVHRPPRRLGRAPPGPGRPLDGRVRRVPGRRGARPSGRLRRLALPRAARRPGEAPCATPSPHRWA